MPRKNALPQAKSSMVTGSLGITQSSGLDRLSGYPDNLSNGFIVKIPYVQSIKRVNNKQQEVSYTDQIWGESSERTVVYAAGVTVTYRINPDYSAWIYANVSDYKQNA